MCKSHATHPALILYKMLSATWYEETAQLISLTNLNFGENVVQCMGNVLTSSAEMDGSYHHGKHYQTEHVGQ